MLLFGHRGYSDQYSENTMLAFSKAIETIAAIILANKTAKIKVL